MDFQIRQSSRANTEKTGYWHWSVWIEAPQNVLDRIEYVEYILHPTYPNRVRKRSSPESKFKLSSVGWGEFTIFIRVYYKDRIEPEFLSHYLSLFSEDETTDRGAAGILKVFISSALRHKEEVEKLQKVLEDKEIQVESANSVDPGSEWQQSIQTAIRNSDVFVLFGQSEMNKFQEEEYKVALRENKKIVIVGDTNPPTEGSAQILNNTDDLLRNIIG